MNIIDLARQAGLELKKQSSRLYKANCIFHDDRKTPNLFFYPETNTFKCYACGKHGDAINFYAELRNISNKQAINDLTTTIGATRIYKRPERLERLEAGPDDHILILEALREFSSRSGDLTEESFKYLTGDKRGLTEETIKQFKIFDIKDYKETKNFLAKKFLVSL